jgi:HSP20 family protein
MYRRCNTASGAAQGGPAFGKYGSPFNDRFGAGSGGYFRRPKYNVPINIVENETYYEVYMYALGFEKDNIKISVVDDVLYISGSRTIDENNRPNFIRQEYPIKSFERIVNLRGQIDNTQLLPGRKKVY